MDLNLFFCFICIGNVADPEYILFVVFRKCLCTDPERVCLCLVLRNVCTFTCHCLFQEYQFPFRSSPRANITLSGKKRRKLLKQIRHQEKVKSEMDVEGKSSSNFVLMFSWRKQLEESCNHTQNHYLIQCLSDLSLWLSWCNNCHFFELIKMPYKKHKNEISKIMKLKLWIFWGGWIFLSTQSS